MSVEETDIVVIGMGPGGEDTAGRLAQAGLHVTGVEAKLVGGECPYWGCVPSKTMIRAADLLAEVRRIPAMAGSSAVSPDWGPVASRIRAEATHFWDGWRAAAVDRLARAIENAFIKSVLCAAGNEASHDVRTRIRQPRHASLSDHGDDDRNLDRRCAGARRGWAGPLSRGGRYIATWAGLLGTSSNPHPARPLLT